MDNTKKTIYLHIGMCKTGTTSIQSFFFKNKENFKAKGLLYPTYNNHDTNLRCMFEDKVSKNSFKKLFLKEISESNCDKILLSDEMLSELTVHRASLDVLLDILKELGFKIKTIVYIRPIAEWVASYYQEKVKSSYKPSYKTIETFKNSALVKSLHTLLPLAEKVGTENIIFKAFEKTQLKNQNLIEDFLEILGFDLDDSFDILSEDKNIGIGRNHCELLKILHNIGFISRKNISRILSIAPKDDTKVIETLSDEFILSLTEEYRPIFKEIAKLCGRENFFVNEFPKCYGKERPAYDKVSFTKEQIELLYEEIDTIKKGNTILKKLSKICNSASRKLFIKIFGLNRFLKRKKGSVRNID